MRLLLSFVALGDWERSERELRLPMEIELPEGKFDVCPISRGIDLITREEDRALKITGERGVDPVGLKVVDNFTYELDDVGELVLTKALDSPENDLLVEGAMAIVGSISFAIGVALHLSTVGGDEFRNEFVAESERDHALLGELGTDRARPNVGATTGVEPFGDVVIDAAFVGELASRRVASAYLNILGEAEVSTKFLALWRTLEFAFQSEGRALVDLLLDFPHVQEMEFDRGELEELRAIRGRLSHAVSRSGLRELRRANGMAITSIGRLWSLVDWIVLSKRGLGRDNECAPIAKLRAFIDREGRIKMADDDQAPGVWFESWSSMSPRFHH